MVDWLRKQVGKSIKRGFIVGKALMDSFPTLFNSLAWNVGDGKQIVLRKYPFIGGAGVYKLSPNLIQILHSKGLFDLSNIKRVHPHQTSSSYWMT